MRLPLALACLAAFALAPASAGAHDDAHGAQAAPQVNPIGASLVALIGQPERFDGKRVQVIGAIRLQTEAYQLCLHADDLARNIGKNCLWLELGVEQRQALASLDGQYVTLLGTFAKDDTGHMGLNSGALHDVDRVMAWPMR